MRSCKSVIQAIFFIIRLQNSASSRKKSRGERFSRRCNSLRNRRVSVLQSQKHRGSAPNASATNVLAKSPAYENQLLNETNGTFLGMSQPYKIAVERCAGRVTLSIRTSDAHQMASFAITQREPLRRNSNLEQSGQKSLRRPVIRQGSEDGYDKTKRDDKRDDLPILQHKVVSSTISSLSALQAVRQNDTEGLKAILAGRNIRINSRIENPHFSEWTLLEVALMLGHSECARLLLQNGAIIDEGCIAGGVRERLKQISVVYDRTVAECETIRSKSSPSKNDNMQLKHLERQCSLLQKMKNTVKCCSIPDPPSGVNATVTGPNEVTVTWEPQQPCTSDVVFRYKVEWSLCDDFAQIEGSLSEGNVQKSAAVITGLKRGLKYVFRVRAASLRGYSEATRATPHYVIVSSWEEVCDSVRTEHSLQKIEQLSDDIEKFRLSPVWQTIFPPPRDSNVKKKKAGLKNLFSAGSKFLKGVHRGIFLASIIYSDEKLLCTVDDCLPILAIDELVSDISKEDLYWVMKLSFCWDQMQCLQESGGTWSSNAHFRAKFVETVNTMQNALCLKDIGRVHHQLISHASSGATFVVTVRLLHDSQVILGLAPRWVSLSKLLRKKSACSAIDFLFSELVNIINFFESSQIPLQKGLYTCYMKLHSSMNSISVIVPANMPSILPFVFVRENSHVSKEEWEWIRLIDTNACQAPSPSQLQFHRSIVDAATRLLCDLGIDADLIAIQRLYRLQVIQIHDNISFILLLPKIEDVCSAPSCSTNDLEANNCRRNCFSLTVPVFEMIHLFVYNADFINAYCRLSIFIEHFMMIIQYDQRNCLLENDAQIYGNLLSKMSEFQQRLENTWKCARWINNIASVARDKQSKCAVSLSRLFATLNDVASDDADVSFNSDQAINRKDQDTCSSQTDDSTEDTRLQCVQSMLEQPAECSTKTRKRSNCSPIATGVVRVYAAYQCGFARGTSVRLQIASTTTSHEVVALVVEQLAKAAAAANSKPPEVVDPQEFCLAAVIGSRERRLRDDFPPLKLQNPWSKGRLFVRRRDCVLAALQRGNEAIV